MLNCFLGLTTYLTEYMTNLVTMATEVWISYSKDVIHCVACYTLLYIRRYKKLKSFSNVLSKCWRTWNYTKTGRHIIQFECVWCHPYCGTFSIMRPLSLVERYPHFVGTCCYHIQVDIKQFPPNSWWPHARLTYSAHNLSLQSRQTIRFKQTALDCVTIAKQTFLFLVAVHPRFAPAFKQWMAEHLSTTFYFNVVLL